MQAVGTYLIFAAIVLRAAVVLSDNPEFPVLMALLTGYGLLLFGRSWMKRQKPLRSLQASASYLAYLLLQFGLAIGVLIASSYEDFLATLFVPLSLDAVTFLGRRSGFISIAIFSLALTFTLMLSSTGPLFGFAMGTLYSGLCILVGGYSSQVQKAQVARQRNEQTLRALQTAYRQLQGYADQMASLAVEQERNRLARDLHDSVTQTVFSMNLAAQSARLLLDKEPPRAAGQLMHLEELAASAQGEIQALVSHLSPRSVAEASLSAALKRLALEQKARTGLAVSLEVRGERPLSAMVVKGLHSIAQEALTNVAKHSGMCEAAVHLYLEKGNSYLEIEDHGLGFDPGTPLDQRGHLGLSGMTEQAREIGWHLSIISGPGRGTRIQVTEDFLGGVS